jgi:gamma-glutamyltranspeptidase/glutathione hydrolase
MTEEDLAAYAPRWDEPLAFTANGVPMLGAPPPETGGLFVAYALGLLERAGLPAGERWTENPRSFALIARALAEADAIIARYCADPVSFGVPTGLLVSPEHLDLQARLLLAGMPTGDLTPPQKAENAPPLVAPDATDPAKSDSNHLIIVDEAGNWVSMLHTVYGSPFGTGLCVHGVGVNTGNGFGGVSIGPGRRIVTPLTPVIALDGAGTPWFALGTPSYPPPYIALVLLNMLTCGMSPEDAIEAPRFRIDPQQPGAKTLRTGWAAGTLTAETRIPAETLAGATRLGLTVAPLGDFNWHVGSVHLALRDRDTGELRGYADSRRGGYAAGF